MNSKNRLAKESSPYLKQHSSNPVDWYPWGDEALERARSEDLPILLSVGYSACHWCHVMAHESFENPVTAELMNRLFINIKVDREERPDLDQIYQNVAQIFTRGGGWPLTVFLTPDLKPFFGGTYFPPDDRYGRPGFPRVLEALSRAYRDDRASVLENAEKLTESIRSLEIIPNEGGEILGAEKLRTSMEEICSHMDRVEGGIGNAPKFPNPMLLTYLWRAGKKFQSKEAVEAALLSLEKMAKGGIFDQLGGGFHRYSVDGNWSVPHFEKMLYDNALLLQIYSEVLLDDAWEVNRDRAGLLDDRRRALYIEAIQKTVKYVLREMTSESGLFYSAQDADSEGEEGKFFVWDPSEVGSVLTPEETEAVLLRFGIHNSGNFEDGKTVLYQALTVKEVAEKLKIGEPETEKLLSAAQQKLFKIRSARVTPGLDDKSLASWNGLMISGLAWASFALKNAGLDEESRVSWLAADRAFNAAIKELVSENGRLWATWKEKQGRYPAYLDDYAFLCRAALDLTRFSPKPSRTWIENAVNWVETVLKLFQDPEGAGYFFTADDHEKLLQRPKALQDSAIPAGTAVILSCLQVLAEMELPHSETYRREVEKQLAQLGALAGRYPTGQGELLSTFLLFHEGPLLVKGLKVAQDIGLSRVWVEPSISEKSEILLCGKQKCFAQANGLDELKTAIDRYL